MQTIEQRAEARRKNITITKIDLHSKEHHSFHQHLSIKKSWEILTRLSKEAWIEETGEIPDQRVDKSIYKFISLSSKV